MPEPCTLWAGAWITIEVGQCTTNYFSPILCLGVFRDSCGRITGFERAAFFSVQVANLHEDWRLIRARIEPASLTEFELHSSAGVVLVRLVPGRWSFKYMA